MARPFFSIIIPTYNRAKFLKATIAITLKQTFQDFEIVISNNCSTDETEEVVLSFNDPRIRYFRNKTNIGAEPNMRKAISYARGKYLFTMGDDDFILFENTLKRVKGILEKKMYGFIRLNLIERKFIGEGLRKSIITIEDDIEIKRNSEAEEIIIFFKKIAAGHFAGLVIKNYKGIADDFLHFPETAWIKIIYKNTKDFGAYYVANLYMIITWSQGDILTHYIPKNDRLMFEEYTDFIFNLIPKDKISDYKLRYYSTYVILQPVIKLYSSNKNLIMFDKRLLKLEPRLKKNIFFWIALCVGLFTPRSIWKLMRIIQHKNKNTINNLSNKDKVYKKFNIINKRYLSI